MISDQENHNTFNRMTNIENLSFILPSIISFPRYKNRRDQLIQELVIGINKKREGTKFKPIKARWLAILCNRNPFLKSDDELELLKRECEKRGDYRRLFWMLK